MKKKLTKEQKENRLKRFRKAKDITLYISLAINTLFVILMSVVGCSSKNVDEHTTTNNFNPLKNQLVNRNDKINDFDVYSNNSTICYDLTNLDITTRDYISTGSYHYFSTLSNIILFGGDGIVWSDANEIYVDFNVYQGGVDGNFIEISALHRNADHTSYRVAGRYWGYSNGAWDTINLQNQSGYDTLSGFYIAFNITQTNENQFGLIGLLENCFNTIDYKDFDLSQNWSPYAFFTVDENYIHTGFIDDQYILTDTIFAINGRLYDKLIIEITQTSLPLEVETPNGVVSYPALTDNVRSFIINVHAENTTNNEWLTLYSLPRGEEGSSGGLKISPYNLRIKNYSNLRIRLFAINLSKSVAGGYTNGNSLSVEYIYSNFTGDGNIANVFSLFSSAFNGIASILAIQILPGFTLGILIFVPLIAIIIFALLRILKK